MFTKFALKRTMRSDMSRRTRTLALLLRRISAVVVLGAAIGIALGAVLGNVVVGTALGALIGLIAGVVLEMMRRRPARR